MNEDEIRDEVLYLRAEIKRLRKSLAELTPPLPLVLRRRGFRIFRKEPFDDLLLPEARFIDEYYRLLQKYSFRLFLRDVIHHQHIFALSDVTRFSTQEVTEKYIAFLLKIRLIEREGATDSYRLMKQQVKGFGPTLEWFVSEVLKREFDAEAVWGAKFKRPIVGGDYDVIAKVDSSLLSIEVKSSPPRQIYAKEISAFFERLLDLLPDIAIFFIDTELRMKDKVVPMFEDEIRQRSSHGLSTYLDIKGIPQGVPPVVRMEKELFQIQNKIFIINAKDSIVNNIDKVLRRCFRRSQHVAR
ncbi:MAG TPA: hypothetical protein VEI28_00350 [Thermodesulfovibrionales bacterium]|nr:hypothetical protein [Thermodesulfovibrionales bacterium]